MDWKKIYEERTVTAEQAFAHIKPGDSIFPSHAAAEPQYLFRKLVALKDQFEDLKIVQGLNVAPAPYAEPECEDTFKIMSFFLGKKNRKCVQEGRGEFIPIHFQAQPRAIREGKLGCDVGFIQVTPPDENGYVNMGTSCDQTRTVVEKARITVAQVNQKMPHVCGDTSIHVSEIDYFVPFDEPICAIAPVDTEDPVSVKIAEHIVTLIDDGATLQMGQGTIPNAILTFLKDKKDLGIHTEVCSDTIIPLVEAGVFNGKAKNIDKGKIVATFLQGTQDFYEYVDNNERFELRPVEYVNSPAVIAQNDKVVAINSALEVDLMGQVVADAIGPMNFSGIGGQMDFIRAAEMSKDGRGIIALPSTAKGGEISRITAVLKTGTPISETRQDVHYVVTEYGIAHLFGKPLNERAEALIAIAHPKFRKQLREAYRAYCESAGRIYF